MFLDPQNASKSLADPTGGAYSAPPDPLAGLRGPTSKGPTSKERGEEGRGGEVGEGRGFCCVIVLEG